LIESIKYTETTEHPGGLEAPTGVPIQTSYEVFLKGNCGPGRTMRTIKNNSLSLRVNLHGIPSDTSGVKYVPLDCASIRNRLPTCLGSVGRQRITRSEEIVGHVDAVMMRQ